MNEKLIIENLKRIDKHLTIHSKKLEELKELLISQKFICEKKFIKRPNMIALYSLVTAFATVVSVIINNFFDS